MSESVSAEIDEKIAGLGDWRGATLAAARKAILSAGPEIAEEIKWRKPSNPSGVPTWTAGGVICTGETYKDKVKLTFAKGAALSDPAGLFNASLEGSTRRAIDFFQGDTVDGERLTALVKRALEANGVTT